ncbi:uroporphyrinogen-III synthase [Synchytrium endobioticum]|uniref:Uroporphyrinogen-III synthase n=1 Tax=Synchytrium endobioticum TaxID=286115 RepID=A0A507DDK4_9FUNG|nr:uroporphyrinogen-III synthase [Synchytrium endobioticum]
MAMTRGHIVFLRARAEVDGDPGTRRISDPYESAAHNASYTSTCIPLFTSNMTNMHQLCLILQSARSLDNHHGIIVTSKRAIDALECGITRGRDASFSANSDIQNNGAKWKTLPIWTVGPATSAKAKEIGFTNVLGGDRAGSASLLADFIINDHQQKRYDDTKSYLFLCGEKRRDELPSKLANAQIQVTELRVYETGPNPCLEDTLKGLDTVAFPPPYWVVFFSPSGVDVTLELLQKLPWFNVKHSSADDDERNTNDEMVLVYYVTPV